MGKNKKFPPGNCIHCLETFVKLTSDHVFPVAWYPDVTPKNLEKWQAPSCKNCNEEHGRNEEELLYRLGLCVNPSEASASGISQRVLRALDPAYAKVEKDRRIRAAKKKTILRELVQLDQLPDYGILPGFGPRPGQTYTKYTGIPVPEAGLKKLTTKIVKGMTYVIEGKYIDENYDIETYFLNDQDFDDLLTMLNKYGATFERGPGVVVQRAVPYDRPDAAWFYVQVWGRFKFHVTVTPKELAQKVSKHQ
jgi:hypothetical protein